MKFNLIECGDCLKVLRDIPDSTFDMSFADPPFNLEKGYTCYSDNLGETAYIEWCRQWIAEMVRITKPNGSLFLHNIPKWLTFFSSHLNDLGMHFKHWIAWDAATAPMGRSLQPAHYGILYYCYSLTPKVYELRMPHKRCRDKTQCNLLLKDYGGKKESIHPFGPLVSDVWSDIHRCKHDKTRNAHPCQLPVHLLERLILLSTDEGDCVFDPFMGTGTTAVAAKRLGRQYYGIELDPLYLDICNKRLEAETLESKVGSAWVSCHLNRVHTIRDCDVWDSKNKEFRQTWKSLFKNWPETPEQRKALNFGDLEYLPSVKERLTMLCESRKSAA
jgi:site-specific DNA-methyltransferase (adenine-specific)